MDKITKQQRQELSEDEIVRAAKLVRFNVVDYSIEHLTQKVQSSEYYIPEYQREFTWNKNKKTRFIESVMIGLPIPFVFFWQDEEGKFEIVDGSQRLRTLEEFVNQGFKLTDMDILPQSKGLKFKDFSKSRQRKFLAHTIRGILLEHDTSAATRTEMFNRINTGGSKANEAEVRRGALPGPITDLVIELSESQRFVDMTPINVNLIKKREREELVVRFLAYTSRYNMEASTHLFEGYKDKPREFIYEYVEEANKLALENEDLIDQLKNRFFQTLDFIGKTFPNGFQKPNLAKQIPRARYEAIAVGSALAIKHDPSLLTSIPDISGWIDNEAFTSAITSDGANTRSKLHGRVLFVRDHLLGRSNG